jgi:hypothetical protein
MSVVVVVKFPGAKIDKFREVYARNTDTMVGIATDGRTKGAVHHMFVEDENGDLMVIDEWGSTAEFEAFFATQDAIKGIMSEVGMTGPPTTVSYPVLDTPDKF